MIALPDVSKGTLWQGQHCDECRFAVSGSTSHVAAQATTVCFPPDDGSVILSWDLAVGPSRTADSQDMHMSSIEAGSATESDFQVELAGSIIPC